MVEANKGNFTEQEKSKQGLKSFKHFVHFNQDYFTYGPSQKSIQMIDEIINTSPFPEPYKRGKLRETILSVVNDTCLNELQLAIWAILIENFSWADKNSSLYLDLLTAAIYVKEYLGENIEYIINKFTEKDSNFKCIYFHAKNIFETIKISTKAVNIKYEKLSEKKSERQINYSYYVDEIIAKYNPYENGSLKRMRKEECLYLDFFAV